MKLALCALLLVACSSKKKHEETPAPPPVPVAPADAAVAPDAPPPPPCIVAVNVATDKVQYSDGTTRSEFPRKKGGKLDFSSLKSVATKCNGANLEMDGKTSYEDVMAALDSLVAQGFVWVNLGSNPHHDATQPPPGTTRSSQTNEGWIVGRFETTSTGEMPIIVIDAKREVTVQGKRAGTPAGANIAQLVVDALPDATTTHTVIIQADKGLTYGDIHEAVTSADRRGYSNILFGMTTKKK